MKEKLAIIGLGLMGGSLGLAARRNRLPYSIVGYARREETRRIAMRRRAVEFAFDNPQDAVEAADLAVFCLPVLTIPQMIRNCMSHFRRNCIVTDVGSTKAKLVCEMKPLFRRSEACFVGSHPMAGSDETGIEAASADLYEGALAVVTDGSQMSEVSKQQKAVRKVSGFWRDMGMNVVVMTPREHDKMIAKTSHLPHLAAAMLVSCVCGSKNDKAMKFCGTGFRDTTRIAGGSEDIWHDIVKTNSEFVSRELDEFRRILDKIKHMIDSGNFEGVRYFLADIRDKRRAFDKG